MCGFCDVCVCGFSNVWVCMCGCVCVGFVMCGGVCVCVSFVMSRCFGYMCTCIDCVLYCFVYVRIFILICFVCTGVRTTATE
jgi:hypothetical protein